MKNILVLAENDNSLVGHGRYFFDALPLGKFNKRLVTYTSLNQKEDYAFHYKKSIKYKIFRRLKSAYYQVFRIFRYGTIIRVNKNNPEYCFFHHDDCCISAKKILKKCHSFKPDIIAIFWVSNFISPKTIRDLYELTQAEILMAFVDEAPLSGGCHYHCDCNGYLLGCKDCPAIINGKKIVQIQMQNRIKYLKGLPITLFASPYDIEKALETEIYSGCNSIPFVHIPNVVSYNREESRHKYGITNQEFVVFIAAAQLNDPRKGVRYAIEALNLFAKKHSNVTVLVSGNITKELDIEKTIRVINTGYLSVNDMFMAMCASDVFVSTTIADSGPMMVNFAFSLKLPVVSFDLGIAHTLIQHKVTGFLADYKKTTSVMDGLEYIYNLGDSDRKVMGEKQYKIIKSFERDVESYDYLLK